MMTRFHWKWAERLRAGLLWFALAGIALHAAAQVPAPENTPVAIPLPPPALALILPGPQTPFAPLAEAVREGFIAARAAVPDLVAIQVVEVDAGATAAVKALASARERGVRLAVGPLTRDAVNAVVERGDRDIVTLLLAMPDKSAVIPSSQIALGLSVEDEAAFLVRTVLRDAEPLAAGIARRSIIVIGEGVFARRTGAALLAALRAAGETPLTLDYPTIDAAGIAREVGKAEVGKTEGATVFFALDPIDAVQVRTRLPADARLFATSLINAGGAMTAIDLDGVRFVDLPWMIDAERGPLAVFNRAPAGYSGDQQRLYALGIDAFRVANAWLRGGRSIDLDGATGVLRVDRDRSARVERKLAFAVFREGRIQPIDNFKPEASEPSTCGQEKCPDELPTTKTRDSNAAAASR